VRARSFPASPDFFDQAFPSQFGGDENDWEDEDEDDDVINLEPECRPQ
jgi:DnaJ family protein A protein 2